MSFTRYPHLCRWGQTEVEDIEIGKCYIFPKLDGSNGSLWWDERLRAGSRNRELDTVNPGNQDNHGFAEWACSQEVYKDFLFNHSNLVLYGEWLVPHTLTTYQDKAWKKFYVFDIWDNSKEQFVNYDDYSILLKNYGIDFIPCQKIISNPNIEQLHHETSMNTFLIQDGKGIGEGIVIKNYNYINKYGRVTWAKLVTNEFKGVNQQTFKPGHVSIDSVETAVVNERLTLSVIEKNIAKVVELRGPWSTTFIPQLLGTTVHDFITEEIWDICKKYKNPKIDFSFLTKLIIAKIKELKPDAF